jgi:hypothetical protein
VLGRRASQSSDVRVLAPSCHGRGVMPASISLTPLGTPFPRLFSISSPQPCSVNFVLILQLQRHGRTVSSYHPTRTHLGPHQPLPDLYYDEIEIHIPNPAHENEFFSFRVKSYIKWNRIKVGWTTTGQKVYSAAIICRLDRRRPPHYSSVL